MKCRNENKEGANRQRGPKPHPIEQQSEDELVSVFICFPRHSRRLVLI